MIDIKIKSSTEGFRVLTMEQDSIEAFHGIVNGDREVLDRVLSFLCKAFGLVDMGVAYFLTRGEYKDLFGKLPEEE